MKRKIIALLCLSILGARAQQVQTIMDLNANSPFMVKDADFSVYPQARGPQVLAWSGSDQAPLGKEEQQRRITLFRIPNPEITSSKYAITGMVEYRNLPDDAQLEMAAVYTATDSGAGGTFYSQTDQNSGPQIKLTGSSSVRAFFLPMTIDKPGKLIQLEFNIWIHGRATAENSTFPPNVGHPPPNHGEALSFQDLKLVQYTDSPASPPTADESMQNKFSHVLNNVDLMLSTDPNGTVLYSMPGIGVTAPLETLPAQLKTLQTTLKDFSVTIYQHKEISQKSIDDVVKMCDSAGLSYVATPAAHQDTAPSDAQHDHTLKVRWFLIGVGATTSVLFILVGCVVILITMGKQKKDQELRRMASIDS